jgi:hypothetical protein
MKKAQTDAEEFVARVEQARTMRFARGNILLQRGRFRPPSERRFDVGERLAELRARFNKSTDTTKTTDPLQ